VLVVMVGEQVQEMQQAGWIATTPLGFGLPRWMGTWFAIFPTAQGLIAQAGAIGVVLGSYFWAEETRVRRPRRHGQRPAERLDHAPAGPTEAAVGVLIEERLADAS